jgi:hypothetical protein
VALKASVVPLAIDAPIGVTAIETSAAGLTVRVAGVAAETSEPKELVIEALIVALVLIAASVVVARPGVVVLMTTLVSDELHVTLDVMFWVVLFVKVPVAVNCCVLPAATVVVPAGVIAIDCKAGAVTVTPVEPVMPDRFALMVGVPVETAVIRPPTTVAVAPLEDQVAWEVMSAVLPSL